MSRPDEALTLTAFFAERERSAGRFLAEVLLELFHSRGIASSVMLRGIAGFGPANVIRSDRSLSLSEDPPVTVTAVDTAEPIAALADQVAAMTGRGLLTVHPTSLGSPPADTGSVRVTLYLARRQRVDGEPGYVAAIRVLQRCGFAGAEAFLGVDGTVAGQRRRARFFSSNSTVPLVVSGVGRAAAAAIAIPELQALVPHPLLTVEPVLVCKQDGLTLATPADLPGSQFQKLTVRTTEDAYHHGRPIHRALIRRLKEADASGATALRGLWGFHGSEEPHGDRFLQLTRQVPVSTVIIDTPQNISAAFAIVDELTAERGSVVCEAVPTVLALRDDHGPGAR
ncbi:MAG: DUF190 domain-containing protein [Mycobacterium sp.]